MRDRKNSNVKQRMRQIKVDINLLPTYMTPTKKSSPHSFLCTVHSCCLTELFRPLDRIGKRPLEPQCVVLMTYEIRGQNVISHGSFLLTHHNGGCCKVIYTKYSKHWPCLEHSICISLGCCCNNLRTTTLKNVNNSKFFFHILFLTYYFLTLGMIESCVCI